MKWLVKIFYKLKETLLFVFLVAFPLCMINSFIAVVFHTEYEQDFIRSWMYTFAFNFLITYPLALLIVPIVKKIMERIL
ncbi:DUF2798 domain-containing protein [Aquimarina aquimarini]